METQKTQTELENWNTEKGTPFDFSYSDHSKDKFDFPEIIMMDWQEDADMDALLPEVITNVNFNLHLKTVFETIQFPHQCKILQANEEDAYEKEKYVDGIEMVQEGNRIYSKKISDVKPIIVYLDYPFNKVAQVKINPYDSDGKMEMNFGYIIWQVSRAYADIYKNRWKEFGVWGHAYEDLHLEIMQIRKGNIITLGIGS